MIRLSPVLVLLPLLVLPAAVRAGPEDPEWTREKTDALVDLAREYGGLVSLPGKAAAKDAILERAAALGAPGPRDVKRIVKELFEVAREGPRSDGKSECTAKYEPFPGTYYLAGGGNGKGVFFGLHGGGPGVGDGRTARSLWGGATGKGLIGVFPTANLPDRPTTWQSPEVQGFVMAILREIKRTWRVDTNRIYLAGHSLGGSGAWDIGPKYADLFAAISPNAGGCHGSTIGTEGAVLPGGFLANLFDTPIFFTHYDRDPRVAVADARAAAKELDALEKEHPDGYEHVYVEGEGEEHGFPPGGETGKILSWLVRHERDPYPEKVVWEPNFPAKHLFFWLRKRPVFVSTSRTTRLVASCRKNRVEIEGQQTRGLSVLLAERMFDGDEPVTVVVNGETRYEGVPAVDPRALLESILENIDPEQVFAYRIDL